MDVKDPRSTASPVASGPERDAPLSPATSLLNSPPAGSLILSDIYASRPSPARETRRLITDLKTRNAEMKSEIFKLKAYVDGLELRAKNHSKEMDDTRRRLLAVTYDLSVYKAEKTKLTEELRETKVELELANANRERFRLRMLDASQAAEEERIRREKLENVDDKAIVDISSEASLTTSASHSSDPRQAEPSLKQVPRDRVADVSAVAALASAVCIAGSLARFFA